MLKKIKTISSSLIGEFDTGYLGKWLVIALLIGVAAGITSIIFYWAVNGATWLMLGKGAGYTPPVPGGEGQTIVTTITRRWMIPIICALGGLLSGLILFKLSPEAMGPGTDAAINSFHNKDGYIRRRVPFFKMLASAVTLGSGGSAGREGPAALMGAGFGSTIADLFKLDAHDRRVALAIGIGAGMGAIFKAPLGGAILGAEILYSQDFEFEALWPSFIASIVGYSIFASWNGWAPIFSFTAPFEFTRPTELLGYALLGIVCGIFGIAYGRSFHGIRRLFARWKVPAYIKPAIGGLLVGTIGIFLPQVLGIGYGWLQFDINGNTAVLPIGIMIAVALGKLVAACFSVGSGGSGGEFAPGLVIGGMIGGVTWFLLHNFTGFVPSNPAPYVVLGMMALFGGIAKAPLAIIIMVSEMTGNYNLLVPSMVAVVIAYFMTGNNFLYESQVATRSDSPAHQSEYSTPLLDKIPVREAMVTNPVTVSPDEMISDVIALMRSFKIDATPVLESGKLIGILTNLDIVRLSEAEWPTVRVREKMTTKLVVGYADETLADALNRMTQHNVSHLPIVEHSDSSEMAGFLAIHGIAETYGNHKNLKVNRVSRVIEKA
jgi:CIC family chloride channel protein